MLAFHPARFDSYLALSQAMFMMQGRTFVAALLVFLSHMFLSHIGNSVVAQSATATDASFFVDKLYPAMITTQCHLCHNDNGVASATTIEFPAATASREQIIAFGYGLREFVNRESIDQSPLLLKPTGRDEHTGGVRIAPGSAEEKLLRAWVIYLAGMSEAEQQTARELIARAAQWQLQPLSIRRLTHSQYNNTVRDLLGDQSAPANGFPKEDFVHGFKNQIEGQGISPLLAEAYSQAAERLARSAFRGGDTRQLLPVKPRSANDVEAATRFIDQFGLKAFRRPLSSEERDKYVGMLIRAATATEQAQARGQATGASATADPFLSGATLVVEAMLQSPNFLFHIERRAERQQDAARWAAFATASRLSYLLWDTMPDDEMLRVAAAGGLSTPQQIESRARQMLEDPRAAMALDEFLSQWMRFDRVTGATRDRRRYREFNAEVAAAMVEETRQLFRHLVWKDQNFMEFFTADYTFINANLAQLYGLPAPTEDFTRVDYPADSGRSGILGHGTFLVSTSKPAETSPTARGVFIRNQFLAQEIAPPPPGVNAVLPDVSEDKPLTNRQRLDVHLNSEACASCHRLIDPIGFAFEQYDAIGAFHEKISLQFGTRDNPVIKELPADTTAFIQGMESSEFSRPKELGKLLSESETCQRCIVKQYFRYAFGREETAADQPILDEALTRFRSSGFRFRELIVAMVTSKLFLQQVTPPR